MPEKLPTFAFKIDYLKLSDFQLYKIILGLLLPALLLNLGLVAFINDEAIRALVALEMDLSGNYIVPTLFGEFYYNKPPFYNWILLVFSKLYGQSNEFISRLPTVVFLLAYAATVYHFSRKYCSKKWSFINAFTLITCGRILFYDSFLGLIDICFSWTIYSLFMVVYHRWKAGKLYQLFMVTYILGALAFLMKGLPALVFLGTTLLAHFIYQKEFKKLFLPAHFVGIGIFVTIIGLYYWAYHQYNDLEVVFNTLFNESAKRTPVEYSFFETITHLFTFPFEMTFHFLPWSFLVIFLFQKGIKSKLVAHPFIAYNALIFVTTIPLYWVSVQVYPRYLFMHVPLVFSVLLYLYEQQKQDPKWQFFLTKKVFNVLFVLAPLAVVLLPFLVEMIQEVSYFYWKIASVLVATFTLSFYYYWKKNDQLLSIIALLLVLRIGFNWFILPTRNQVDRIAHCRESAIEFADKYQDKTVYNYKENLGWNPASAYYITNGRKAILKTATTANDTSGVYLVNPFELKRVPFEKIGKLEVRDSNFLVLVGRVKN